MNLISNWVFLGVGLVLCPTYTLTTAGDFVVEISHISLNSMTEWAISFYVDVYSCLFSSVVLFISVLVLFYSGWYIYLSEEYHNFTNLVVGFVISMLLLIYSNTIPWIFWGWDGLGLVSFVLVIYYNNMSSLNSGSITIIINRLGDGIILIIVGMLYSGGLYFNTGLGEIFVLSLLLLLVANTNSAQVPFSSWLPLAIAAPTPVSSLVHSSTLVTAGMYLLFRLSHSINLLSTACLGVSLLGIIIGGLQGALDTNIKNVVAFSTISQVALIGFCLASGWYDLMFSHLIFHAFFNANIFLCVGVAILSSGSQDTRLGGVVNSFSLSLGGLISSLNLVGWPFLVGFYSKEIILGIAAITCSALLASSFALGVLLTLNYSYRLITTLNSGTSTPLTHHAWAVPVFILSVMCVFSHVILGVITPHQTWVVGGWGLKGAVYTVIFFAGTLFIFNICGGILQHEFAASMGYINIIFSDKWGVWESNLGFDLELSWWEGVLITCTCWFRLGLSIFHK